MVRVRTTNGHEAEAKADQMRKKPSRIGMFVLKILGHQPAGAGRPGPGGG